MYKFKQLTKIMNSENYASLCRRKTDDPFTANASSVCPGHIICLGGTHHPFFSSTHHPFFQCAVRLFFGASFVFFNASFVFSALPGRYTIVYLIFLLFILCRLVGCRGGYEVYSTR
ncbi:hypothetical protein BACEGG_00607 [Bacteroides eggerthii DSM 20697]|nr:hypothetical protein BACEGG_00607 [Bacteroides eggerthii DSM 20697]